MWTTEPRLPRRLLPAFVIALAGTARKRAAAAHAPWPDRALPHVAARLAAGEALRIVAFGSSSTEGAGASSPAASYPSRLQAALAAQLPVPVTVLNRGIGGEDADDMARRLPAILAERPDLVIWQTGSNDPLRGVPLRRFEAETRAGVAAMRAAGSDVMLMGPQLCNRLDGAPATARYRAILNTIGRDFGVPVIHRYQLMSGWLRDGKVSRAALLAGDGLHMADAGYALLGEEVGREILAGAGFAPRATAAVAPSR